MYCQGALKAQHTQALPLRRHLETSITQSGYRQESTHDACSGGATLRAVPHHEPGPFLNPLGLVGEAEGYNCNTALATQILRADLHLCLCERACACHTAKEQLTQMYMRNNDYPTVNLCRHRIWFMYGHAQSQAPPHLHSHTCFTNHIHGTNFK